MDSTKTDWFYQIQASSLWQRVNDPSKSSENRRELIDQVRKALALLPENERQVVELYYFEGKSIAEIAARRNRSTTHISGLRRRALRRLKYLLTDFVEKRFGIKTAVGNCLICKHPQRAGVESVLNAKREEEPYSVIISKLKKQFNLKITSPQTIIGHLKYHNKGEVNDASATQEQE